MSERELLQASLNKFYESILHRYQPSFDNNNHLDGLSSPLLISIHNEYLNARIRIMFVGKETNG
ncbi:hypothetical protein [Undibacterium sp. Ji49W]|uniref:hypothetical protein n=1 Tax=Undibacterium sp. Ji49W TaxID=3413040 RepID=UPI003BEFDF06